MVKRKHEPQSLARVNCVLAVYNKTLAQRISKHEFKLWTIFQRTESRVGTFHRETCVMSYQSLSRQGKRKRESPIVVVSPKSDHGSCEKVYFNYLSSPIYSYFSITESFFEVIIYERHIPLVTVFKCQFVQQAYVMKRLLLKLIV